MLKRTPLFAVHQRLGGRMVEFGGWEMPVQYRGIIEEHLAVRRAAGIFDISHMGEVFVSGSEAGAFLNHALTNDVRKLEVGYGQYTLLCNERGGVVDDLYLYRIEPENYLMILNASRTDADVEWLERQLPEARRTGSLTLDNASDRMGAVAIQGPRVPEFIDACFAGPAVAGKSVGRASDLAKNQIAGFVAGGETIWVSRTGYTGEDGFEVVVPGGLLASVWERVLAEGTASGLVPCGLGARDTLRTEMGYPLYGHELDENTTPIEAGLSVFVSFDKGAFVGREVLARQKTDGVTRRCAAFRMSDRSAPPRPHYPVWSRGESPRRIGETVSGTQSPSLGLGIGMAYLPPELASPGTAIDVEIRGRRFPAEIVRKPIYRRPGASEAKPV